MYYKFQKELKLLTILLVITIIFIVIGFGVEFSILFFIYSATLLVLPVCFKDNNISLKTKVGASFSVVLVSVLAFIYFSVRQRVIYLYIFCFFISILFSVISNFRNKRNQIKKY